MKKLLLLGCALLCAAASLQLRAQNRSSTNGDWSANFTSSSLPDCRTSNSAKCALPTSNVGCSCGLFFREDTSREGTAPRSPNFKLKTIFKFQNSNQKITHS
jgi:hypothetical protein